jgi:hypothetical protein
MNGREFVQVVKSDVVDLAVQSTVLYLVTPQQLDDDSSEHLPELPEPEASRLRIAVGIVKAGVRRWRRQNEWFRSLDQTQRETFIGLLRECAEHSALNFCRLFDLSVDDAADETTSDPNWRRFRIQTAEERGQEIVVNLEKGEELSQLLHDLLFSERGL